MPAETQGPGTAVLGQSPGRKSVGLSGIELSLPCLPLNFVTWLCCASAYLFQAKTDSKAPGFSDPKTGACSQWVGDAVRNFLGH